MNAGSFLAYTLRCRGCKRFLTKLDVMEKLAKGDANMCTCGGHVIEPSTAKWWEELFLWRSWRMWFAIKRGILPPPSEMEPIPVQPIPEPTEQVVFPDPGGAVL